MWSRVCSQLCSVCFRHCVVCLFLKQPLWAGTFCSSFYMMWKTRLRFHRVEVWLEPRRLVFWAQGPTLWFPSHTLIWWCDTEEVQLSCSQRHRLWWCHQSYFWEELPLPLVSEVLILLNPSDSRVTGRCYFQACTEEHGKILKLLCQHKEGISLIINQSTLRGDSPKPLSVSESNTIK